MPGAAAFEDEQKNRYPAPHPVTVFSGIKMVLNSRLGKRLQIEVLPDFHYGIVPDIAYQDNG